MKRLRPMRLVKPEAESSRACPRRNLITSLGEYSMTSNMNYTALHKSFMPEDSFRIIQHNPRPVSIPYFLSFNSLLCDS